ncbi:MAG TPA: amidohydrolase family protein [Longimicrobiales bacterium]
MRALSSFCAAAALLLGAASASAQEALVIRGGTVHPVSGPAYVGTVVVQNGEIAAAGPDVAVPAGARVIDASGLHVYPGLFDAASALGLTEIGAVDVTNDRDELGDFTPHLQARTAVHVESELIPVARANGITHTMAIPGGGGGFRGGSAAGFAGQGSVFNLDGWTIEQMDIDRGAVMVMNWPPIRTREFDRRTFTVRNRPYSEAKKEHDEAVQRLAEWLDAAREYDRAVSGGAEIRPNLRLAALARVTRGEIPVLVRVDEARAIRDVVAFAEEQGIRLILAGAAQGYKVADLLAKKNIPVILGPTQILPSGPDAPYDEPYANPGKLHAAGVKIAFATFNASDSRTLPYEAAMSIPYGLPHDVALRAVTINGAEMLGLGDRLGTIEPGKIANLLVTDGDPLEITTQIEHLIIAGREVNTMNKHRELYEKYRARPIVTDDDVVSPISP